jgi:phosphatidate cytidylyltransferase
VVLIHKRQAGDKQQMLLHRVLSAIIGIPVILFAVWYGGIPLTAIVLILTILGIKEICNLWRKMEVNVWLPGVFAGGTASVIIAHIGGGNNFEAVLFVLILVLVGYLLAVYPRFTFMDISASVFSFLYAGWLLAHLIILRKLPDGFDYVLLVLVCTWSTDTFAYFIGVNFGKHKLAPILSPKKSVEGSAGGMAGSIIAAVIIGLIVAKISLMHYVIIGLLVGILGQVGDLAESALKRMAGVKDSGNIIPGHGGILDRFDSLYITAPVVCYYVKLFILS